MDAATGSLAAVAAAAAAAFAAAASSAAMRSATAGSAVSSCALAFCGTCAMASEKEGARLRPVAGLVGGGADDMLDVEWIDLMDRWRQLRRKGRWRKRKLVANRHQHLESMTAANTVFLPCLCFFLAAVSCTVRHSGWRVKKILGVSRCASQGNRFENQPAQYRSGDANLLRDTQASLPSAWLGLGLSCLVARSAC